MDEEQSFKVLLTARLKAELLINHKGRGGRPRVLTVMSLNAH